MLKQQINKSTTIIDFYQCDNNASQLNNSLFGHDNTFVSVIIIAIAIAIANVIHKLLITIILKQKVKAVITKDNAIITKDNFPEFKSLCLDFNGAYTCVNGIPHKKVNIHVPTKYFIGATPIQPSDFFEYRSIKLYIISFNLYLHIPDMSFGYGQAILGGHYEPDKSNTGNNELCDKLQWIDTFFSNFYDMITISYSLKDTIFNIPVKRFINIKKKFDELFLKYIKQVYNKNVLKILKRNFIDQYINQYMLNNGAVRPFKPEIFNELISKLGWRDESRYFNDFIIENLTIDFFAESYEDKIN